MITPSSLTFRTGPKRLAAIAVVVARSIRAWGVYVWVHGTVPGWLSALAGRLNLRLFALDRGVIKKPRQRTAQEAVIEFAQRVDWRVGSAGLKWNLSSLAPTTICAAAGRDGTTDSSIS